MNHYTEHADVGAIERRIFTRRASLGDTLRGCALAAVIATGLALALVHWWAS